MPTKNIQFSFSGGVFAPNLHGRPDLEKYSLGLRDALNFFVDYRGGVISRPGTEFDSEIPGAAEGIYMRRFQFNTRLANTYLMVFTEHKIRFIQDGAFLLESDQTFTSITDGVATLVAHGLSDGDILFHSTGLYEVQNSTANTLELWTLSGVLSPLTSLDKVLARVYTVTSPYAGADLSSLVCRQRRNDIVITHNNYPPAMLTRNAHTDWDYAEINFGECDLQSPTNVSIAPKLGGFASVNVVVTSVTLSGEESITSSIARKDSIANYTTEEGYINVTWDPVPGAHHYNIYRSIVFPDNDSNCPGQQLGFIGHSLTPNFTDSNIVPDFTRNPPLKYNPFAPGTISNIDVSAGGTGYDETSTVIITDPDGTGFSGIPLITGDAVTGVLILNPGTGYSAPVVTFGGAGSGAAATADATDLTGTYPAANVNYQQRLWCLGSESFPLRLSASQITQDKYSYNQGIFASPSDPIFLDIDSGELTPIRYGELVNDSLFVFTDQSIWQVALQDGNYRATLRTENGVGQVAPLLVNRDILFSLSEGTGVWALRPSNLPNYYVDVDLTTYAGHLFKPTDSIVSWAFAREPYRIVWACTEKGNLLSLTYISEQNVYAWMPHNTQGKVLSVETVKENGVDRVYLAVLRDGRYFLERMALRDYNTPEEIWGVDSGLQTQLVYPDADLTLTQIDTYNVSCSASVSVFSPTDVGAHVRAGSGRGEVLAYISPTQITVAFDMAVDDRQPQSDLYPVFLSGEWSLTPVVTSVSGLYHLEGKEVEIFADGSDFGTATVVDGSITLDQPASLILAGLAYDGFVETLPLTTEAAVIEDKHKRFTGIAMRIEKTRGIYYGIGEAMYVMKQRANEALRAPTAFASGIVALTTRTDWRLDDPVRFEKRGPGCTTILNVIITVEMGDEED